jgi:hypothetical protein
MASALDGKYGTWSNPSLGINFGPGTGTLLCCSSYKEGTEEENDKLDEFINSVEDPDGNPNAFPWEK